MTITEPAVASSSVALSPALDVVAEAPDVLAALKAVKPGVSRWHGSLPVLSGVRIDAADGKLMLTTTDLDVAVAHVIDADVAWAGSVILPFKLLNDIVTKVKSKGTISLQVPGDDTDTVVVTIGMITASVRTLPLDEWPRIVFEPAETYPLDLAALAEVLPAASKDDNRPILTGVLFCSDNIVATDSYRLFVNRLGEAVYPERPGVLVPAAALTHAVKHRCDTQLEVSAKQARITVGATAYITRLIDGEFPNYAQLIPASQPNIATGDTKLMIDAVRQVSIFAKEATPIRLTFERDRNVVSLQAVTQDMGEASADVPLESYDGVDCTVAFNPQFLLDDLTGIGEGFELGFTDALKPAWVRRDDHIRLLMPVRVS